MIWNVLVKGGDLSASSDAIDIFFDGEEFFELQSPRIHTRNTYGTGCTLASCIAAELGKDSQMLSAVKSTLLGFPCPANSVGNFPLGYINLNETQLGRSSV